MNANWRIAVADDELDMREYFEEVLPLLGHEVVSCAKTGKELVERCLKLKPDLIITDIKMPEMDGLEAVAEIHKTELTPVIVTSAYHDSELLERAGANHILAYLVKPIKQADLETAIAMAMSRFGEFQSLRKESSDLRQALEDRKKIEKAKGILMKKTNLDEAEAFRKMQRLARSNNQKLVAIAESIITAEQAF
ncbi:ANTAR domain-containing response regulator [Lignipirellula cremea]|uniref:Putative transcriptional regulatory protein pdtaR n=1 Tax=Lignipirellula cremea TaxID=2528010 RepID=A0A518DPG3_9BACT|nr:response regulator [Lignipirellula cremea]QDU93722.1 putative transcriptional regulatory protein pdtaR [Lignipirellula cremea]